MTDITLQDYDIEIANGDFKISDSQSQNVELILYSKQGEWKQHPSVGCDILQAKNGSIDRFLDREIRVQLDADGFQLERLSITEKGMEINGEYL